MSAYGEKEGGGKEKEGVRGEKRDGHCHRGKGRVVIWSDRSLCVHTLLHCIRPNSLPTLLDITAAACD